jgi:hypothetical protein
MKPVLPDTSAESSQESEREQPAFCGALAAADFGCEKKIIEMPLAARPARAEGEAVGLQLRGI